MIISQMVAEKVMGNKILDFLNKPIEIEFSIKVNEIGNGSDFTPNGN